MKRYETYVESNLMTGETRSWTAEEPNGQWVKFTEAQAIVKQAREALRIARRNMRAASPASLVSEMDAVEAALAALDAFGEGE